MSDRLVHYERHKDMPHGKIDQILRQLELAGCDPDMIQRFLRSPSLISLWVDAGKAILQNKWQYELSEVRLFHNQWVGIALGFAAKIAYCESDKHEIAGIMVESNGPNYARDVKHFRVTSNDWTTVAPGVEITRMDDEFNKFIVRGLVVPA